MSRPPVENIYTKQRAALSRRVGKLMHTYTILSLRLDAKEKFITQVAMANSFEDLPLKAQTLIIKAEVEQKATLN